MPRRTLKYAIILMLFIAGLWLGGAAQVWADGTPTPEAEHGHMEGTPEAETHNHGERIDAGGALVRIVSPADGAVLDTNNVVVRVETTNWDLGEGKHWHLYVNGKEQGMSLGGSYTLQARDLLVGANTLEAVLSNDLHQELNATHRITVTVQALSQTASASNDAVILIAGLAGAVIVIGGGALLLLRKK